MHGFKRRTSNNPVDKYIVEHSAKLTPEQEGLQAVSLSDSLYMTNRITSCYTPRLTKLRKYDFLRKSPI